MVHVRRLAVLLAVAAAADADVVVPETGPLLRGEVEVRAAEGQVRVDGTPRPLAGILLVERADGQLVWAAGFDARVRGYRRMIHEGRRDRLAELVNEAIRARDPELARRLLELARAEGLSGKPEDILRRRLENLEKRPGKRKEERARELRAEAASLETEIPDLLLARARTNGDPDAARLLRAALREKPDHEDARAMLAERVRKPHPFADDLAWLDWHVDLESRGFAIVPDDDVEVKRARHYWRPDLHGFASSEVLVLTPILDIPPLRDVALRAHLACATLRELFRTDAPLARPETPLVLHLFVHEANFRERVSPVNPLPPYFNFDQAEWDLKDDVTRLLWRSKERDLLYGTAHEVARHWLWSRNPRYSIAQVMQADPSIAGYWVEVGLAALVAEAAYDLDRGVVDLAAGAADSRRFVRTHAGDLFPWNSFLLFGRDDVHLLNRKEERRGGEAASWVFARQATALSHYLLFADGGARRAALADFLVHRYRGEQPKLAPGVAFGASAQELGAAVAAWVAK
jgi:hypothetical protein